LAITESIVCADAGAGIDNQPARTSGIAAASSRARGKILLIPFVSIS
jgi:hypothetical protein